MTARKFTRLLPRAPFGVGTGRLESLTSLVKRTAGRNSLSVASVVGLLRKVESSSPAESSGTSAQGEYRPLRLANGGGLVSLNVASALGALTGQANLLNLSLHRWNCHRSAVLVVQVDEHRKWCPACYSASASSNEEIFDQLAWTIEGVQVCSMHRVVLESNCAECGGGPFSEITGTEVPGFCPKCYGWLGGVGRALDFDHDHTAKYLAWVAECSAQLVAVEGQAQLEVYAGFPEMIRGLADHHFEGQIAPLARVLGRPKSLVTGWARGQCRPRWGALCQLSYAFHVPMIDLLTGNTGAIAVSVEHRLPLDAVTRKPRRRKSSKTKEEIEQFLDQVSAGQRSGINSVLRAAEELGMNVKSLRNTVPTRVAALAVTLAERRRALSAHRAAAHEARLVSALPSVVERLRDEGVPLTRRAIEQALGKEGLSVPWNLSAPLLRAAHDSELGDAGD